MTTTHTKWVLGILGVAILVSGAFALSGSAGTSLLAAAGGGYDEFGYNRTARIFSGPADGVDRILDGTVWGDPAYANDRLVMKWNATWDACNDASNNSEEACAGAWLNNEWNGMKNGSGSVWHYKIIWVGPAGASSSYWQPGGSLVWGSYEILMDQGTDPTGHTWITKATPNGYGAP